MCGQISALIVFSANAMMGCRVAQKGLEDAVPYRWLLLFKFVGVVLFAGGAVASFVASETRERKRAVHGIASPALLLVWVCGFFLTVQLGIAVTELWTLLALVLSLACQMALVHSVVKNRRTPAALLAVFVPLLLVLVLMVFRPTWSSL